MDGYALYWTILSAAVFFIGFLPVEIKAYRDGKPGGTLSETVWQMLYPKPGQPHHRYRRWIRIAFLAAFGWLLTHFLSQGWI